MDVAASAVSILAKVILLTQTDSSDGGIAPVTDAATKVKKDGDESAIAMIVFGAAGTKILLTRKLLSAAVMALVQTYTELLLKIDMLDVAEEKAVESDLLSFNNISHTPPLTKSPAPAAGARNTTAVSGEDDAGSGGATAAIEASPLAEEYDQICNEIDQALFHLCSAPLAFTAKLEDEGGAEMIRREVSKCMERLEGEMQFAPQPEPVLDLLAKSIQTK